MARFVVIKRYDTSRIYLLAYLFILYYTVLSIDLCNQLNRFY